MEARENEADLKRIKDIIKKAQDTTPETLFEEAKKRYECEIKRRDQLEKQLADINVGK